jgi:hypothetical protein
MTTVCSTWFFVSKQALGMGNSGYIYGSICLIAAIIWFSLWYSRESKKKAE